MPRHQSAVKRNRQNLRRRTRNTQKRSQMKTLIKKIRTASDKETASAELKSTVSFLDRMAIKNIIHKNKAANLKSKLTRLVNGM